jgi:hypothetical protein
MAGPDLSAITEFDFSYFQVTLDYFWSECHSLRQLGQQWKYTRAYNEIISTNFHQISVEHIIYSHNFWELMLIFQHSTTATTDGELNARLYYDETSYQCQTRIKEVFALTIPLYYNGVQPHSLCRNTCHKCGYKGL